MPSPFSIAPIPTESMIINESSPQKPTTLLLRTNRPYYYNSWTENNRLRLKNEQLSKRQQSSCCIAFYSLCLSVSAGVMIIVIYRFTEECSSTTNAKIFLIKCLRHWLFLAAICTSFLACTSVIFGVCRYFRSQRLNFLYENERVTDLRNTNGLLPMNSASPCYRSPTLLVNRTSPILFGQTRYGDDEYSSTTVVSSLPNVSPQCKMPPFNYDELPDEAIPIIISMPPNTDIHNKTRYFSSSNSTLSSPQLLCPSARTSNATTTTTNSNKSKTSLNLKKIGPSLSTSYSTGLCEANVWERQRRLSLLR
jgi:hypothetical protein